MPEPLDSIQPGNIERVPESRPTRQMRDDQEDFYPHLVRQKEKKEEQKDQEQQRNKQPQDTYEHDTTDENKNQSKHIPENQAKKPKNDTVEGPGFVLDIKA